MANTKVKFHYYKNWATFNAIQDKATKLLGVVSFIEEGKRLFLGDKEYCLGDINHILDEIKTKIKPADPNDETSKKDAEQIKNILKEISVSSGIDLTIYEVFTGDKNSDGSPKIDNKADIKQGKIYLVNVADKNKPNQYDEWIYVIKTGESDGTWEKLGSFRSEIDLEPINNKLKAQDNNIENINNSITEITNKVNNIEAGNTETAIFWGGDQIQ